MRNSYEEFFQLLPKNEFFSFGLKNILLAEKSKAHDEWKSLLQRIDQKNANLFVRSSGRNGTGNDKLAALYNDVFGLTINFDPTNNQKPTIIIQELTGHRKNVTIANYQVSHVFGRTKNVYCFAAPWNIVFIPKIIDPFTGHEAKGDFVDEFQTLFRRKVIDTFRDQINEYNDRMANYENKISDWASRNVRPNLIESIKKDFSPIAVEA